MWQRPRAAGSGKSMRFTMLPFLGQCDGSARTFGGQTWALPVDGSLAQTPLKGDIFVYSEVQHQPRIAKGPPPGVHMHAYEVFLYLTVVLSECCMQFADL